MSGIDGTRGFESGQATGTVAPPAANVATFNQSGEIARFGLKYRGQHGVSFVLPIERAQAVRNFDFDAGMVWTNRCRPLKCRK
jgi:hypothetical protein